MHVALQTESRSRMKRPSIKWYSRRLDRPTSLNMPERSQPMLSTMSSSLAPSHTASDASATFVAVVVVPWGNPMTVDTSTL